MAPPQFTYGAGNLSYDWTPDTINDLAKALKEAGINRVDSAAIYPFTDPGGSDRLLGIGKFPEKGFTVDTKAMVFGDGSGTMTEAAIEKSLSGSLEGLKIPKVNVFYCHSPDKQTPIAEQAAAMDAEYRKGRFSHLGICNIPTEMLEEWIQVAEQKGYVKPSIYQGQYNLLSRTYETTLFPLLEKHGINFAAFSPLASGFLTGKLTFAKGSED
ncbi:Aldo/keto reductase [Aaosphaeria arxii CBS 175.79]|uniref:Aldo/keto reductase n=1 Tax=Aaosphaeria arxii CBS 175.79 TaxID=1450172 RepID=A0A6A5XFT2_9PLEO|nr:Aldo/keto reductase [Aaosphaeria arxii CBS 175.79]KAF2012095.1 Aldo/keto reductase [Aaosphaeria arxii CBS 175.79]